MRLGLGREQPRQLSALRGVGTLEETACDDYGRLWAKGKERALQALEGHWICWRLPGLDAEGKQVQAPGSSLGRQPSPAPCQSSFSPLIQTRVGRGGHVEPPVPSRMLVSPVLETQTRVHVYSEAGCGNDQPKRDCWGRVLRMGFCCVCFQLFGRFPRKGKEGESGNNDKMGQKHLPARWDASGLVCSSDYASFCP